MRSHSNYSPSGPHHYLYLFGVILVTLIAENYWYTAVCVLDVYGTVRYGEAVPTALRISEELITSTETPHVAWWRTNTAAGGPGAWVVSWLPRRLLTEQQALAAMMLAETVSRGITPEDQQSIESWAHELGLTSSEAIAAVTQE